MDVNFRAFHFRMVKTRNMNADPVDAMDAQTQADVSTSLGDGADVIITSTRDVPVLDEVPLMSKVPEVQEMFDGTRPKYVVASGDAGLTVSSEGYPLSRSRYAAGADGDQQTRPLRMEHAYGRSRSMPGFRMPDVRPGNPYEMGYQAASPPLIGTISEAQSNGPMVSAGLSRESFRGDKPRVRPDIFDGSKSWPDYYVHFCICADINGWDDRAKAAFLAVNLRGPAQQVLADLTAEKRSNFIELVSALNKRFHPDNQSQLYKVQLRTRRRKNKETLPELGQAIRRLTSLAYPEAPSQLIDTLAKDQFIEALEDGETRVKVYHAKPTNLDEAVCLAIELDAINQAEAQRVTMGLGVKKYTRGISTTGSTQAEQSKGDAGLEAMQTKIDQLTKLVEQLQGNMSGKTRKFDGNRQRSNKSTLECWKCGKPGHFQADCPEKAKQFEKQRKGNGQ